MRRLLTRSRRNDMREVACRRISPSSALTYKYSCTEGVKKHGADEL